MSPVSVVSSRKDESLLGINMNSIMKTSSFKSSASTACFGEVAVFDTYL